MMKQDSFILLWLEDLGIRNCLSGQGDLIFENLNLRVDSGEYAAVSGIYGTDKINLINVLGCLKKPCSGKYIFDYNDITTAEGEKLDHIRSKYIGFIFKGLNIVESQTVYKNIELPLLRYSNPDSRKAVEQAAERLGIKDVLHKKARELSDLERHKLALAMALVVKPIMIIADEPGDGLCKTEALAIMDILDEINKEGIAIIAFSDKADIAARAKRHIVFENRKIKSDSAYVSSRIKEGAV